MQGRMIGRLAAGIALAVLAASPASAAVSKGGGFRYVTKQYEVSAATNKTLKAPCPDGTHVFSGGPYNTSSFDHGYAIHSYPYDDGDRRRKPDDGWKVRVLTRNPPVVWTAYAICAKPMPKYLHQHFTVASGPHQNSDTCQPGLNVFSGGIRGDDLAVESQSFSPVNPTLRQWVVRFESFALVQSEIDLYVVCADLPASYANSSDTVGPDSQAGDETECPADKHIVGGGVSHNGTFGEVVIPASRPIGFPGPTTDNWQAYLDHYDLNNSDTSATFTTYAVCTPSLN